MAGLKLETKKPPVALDGGTITIQVRRKPEALVKPKLKSGKPLYYDTNGAETTSATTEVKHPKTGAVLTTIENPPVTEPIVDANGNAMFDYVRDIRIQQPVSDADGNIVGSLTTGTEDDLTDEEKLGLLSTFLSFRNRTALATKLKAWPD